jgi:FtsP/CotA-like multicopper oxidase with cupredoxin domain
MKMTAWGVKNIRNTIVQLVVMSIVLGMAVNSQAAQREYWIAADEVEWDYAPSFPVNLMSGEKFTEDQRIFVEKGIGRTYKKSVFHKYTNAKFDNLAPRSPEEKHLGILGPIIRAVVGDKIIIHFKNNTPFPASIHPHGVFYNKKNEGAAYADGTTAETDGMVLPGGE